MKCIICKHGETARGTTTITLERDHTTLVFKNVPAQVCTNCGEAYVDATTSAQLLAAVDAAIALGVHVEVREFVPA
ncbi:MAG: type II toxin-antitoxin system MqsA family antitoxin [Anaerolineales bacterium]|nr:type II toxin-antitoxin system MqsA family antitoxin [Anaerolineales bacterium]